MMFSSCINDQSSTQRLLSEPALQSQSGVNSGRTDRTDEWNLVIIPSIDLFSHTVSKAEMGEKSRKRNGYPCFQKLVATP